MKKQVTVKKVPEEKGKVDQSMPQFMMEMITSKDAELKQMIQDQAKEYYEHRAKEDQWKQRELSLMKDLAESMQIIKGLQEDQHKKDEYIRQLQQQLKDHENDNFSRAFSPLNAGIVVDKEIIRSTTNPEEPSRNKKIINQLYNVTIDWTLRTMRTTTQMTPRTLDPSIIEDSCYLNNCTLYYACFTLLSTSH